MVSRISGRLDRLEREAGRGRECRWKGIRLNDQTAESLAAELTICDVCGCLPCRKWNVLVELVIRSQTDKRFADWLKDKGEPELLARKAAGEFSEEEVESLDYILESRRHNHELVQQAADIAQRREGPR